MTATPVMYGIPNCNTIKKARGWLEEHGIEYRFHDYKKEGTDPEQLKSWVDEFGWDQIVNTRGMTWRKLDDATKASMEADSAVQLMMDKPSIIKRPLLIIDQRKILGFDQAAYAEAFPQA